MGAYGFRATAQRIPNSLVATYYPGRESILGVVGPLTHSARDLELFMRVVCGPEATPWNTDPVILELPWRGGHDRAMSEWQSGKRPLRLGVMWNDGQVRPLAPIERTLKDAVNRLSGQHNIELKEFAPFESREAWNLIRQLVSKSHVISKLSKYALNTSRCAVLPGRRSAGTRAARPIHSRRAT